jgi:transcriptional regulator with XRE-family HTH domain
LAALSGTSQPAIARLERGLGNPALATLQRLVNAAGFEFRIDLVPKAEPDPTVEAYKRDVDRTLLRENLRKSIDDRLRSLAELQEFGRELERSVRASPKKAKR